MLKTIKVMTTMRLMIADNYCNAYEIDKILLKYKRYLLIKMRMTLTMVIILPIVLVMAIFSFPGVRNEQHDSHLSIHKSGINSLITT